MSLPWPAALIAFVVAVALTWVEFRTSTYPNTGFLIRWSRPFWIYCVIYGLISFGGFLLSDWFISTSALKIEGLGLKSPYVRAVVLGLSSKAILQLNIFTVTSGSTSFPIGFKTLVQVFEPHLLFLISLDEFNTVRQYVTPIANKYPDLNAVKTTIKENIPPSISSEKRAAFENDIEKETKVREAMERFLRFLGKSTFERVFP